MLEFFLVDLTVRSYHDGNDLVLELAICLKQLLFLFVENGDLDFLDEQEVLALQVLQDPPDSSLVNLILLLCLKVRTDLLDHVYHWNELLFYHHVQAKDVSV